MTRRQNNDNMQNSSYQGDHSRQGDNEYSSSRGLSDDYYGTSNQQSQNQPYSQPYGQQNYSYPPQQGSSGYNQGPSNYNQGPPSYNQVQSNYPPQNQGFPFNSPHQNSAAPNYPQQQQQRYGQDDPANFYNRPINPEEDERGLMGALAGAGAGGFAGHKMNHGIIGTLGGAYAGHKLEDAYKQHHNQQTQQQNQQYATPQQGHQQQYQQQGRNPAGNFAASSVDIEVRPGQDPELIAQARRVDGSLNHSALFLNEVLGNNDGNFVWQRDGGFGHSAREVHVMEGGRLLRAELKDCRGNWKRSEIWLDEKITNEDGHLKVNW